MKQVSTITQLTKLRSLMTTRNIFAYIVPSEDAHFSEYSADWDARRAYLSGFTGSAGWAIVTLDKAALSTDGRYFNQASQQLDENWELLKQGVPGVPKWQDWVAQEASGGKTVGVDPRLLSSPVAKELNETIQKAGADLLAVQDNLLDIVWGDERPAAPAEPIKVLGLEFAGQAVTDKLDNLRKEMAKTKSPGFFVTMLDEIAWLFNLRGSDVAYNPVFFAYATITPTDATIYVNDAQLDDEGKNYLATNKITIRPYSAFFEDAAQHYATIAEATKTAAADAKPGKFLMSNKSSWALQQILGGPDFVDEIRSPIGDAKSIKNEVEMEGMRQGHIRDGAALIEYHAWLEDQLVVQKATIDEVQAADKLEQCRAKQQHFVGLSFPTISGSGPNAAIMHYNPERDNCSVIDPNKIYLCDSGAQYFDCSTDVTRTSHFGTPTEEEVKVNTLILKGHIALDEAVFPKGTTGYAVDILARQFLYKTGRDFRHGTGHGVGSYLNIHEGPIGIAQRPLYAEVALSAGNVLSNEPGFYEDGKFGIRIENMMMVVEVETEIRFGDIQYYGFEPVTLTPYCRKLIDVSLLTEGEKAWLNKYHAKVLEKTKSYFEGDALTLAWLERETTPF